MSSELTYCGELVRKQDPDRFLITLVMPPETRPALWALYAFNYEIAKTREVVTETTIGLIRMQWWRDALAKIYEEDTVLQNEILRELYDVIKKYDLPREQFDNLIYAREFDLENVLPASLEGLSNYAEYTNAPLMQLGLKATGEDESEEAVKNIAIGYGVTGLLRAVPYHARQERCYMPADLMGEQGISERALYNMEPGEKFREVTKAAGELADRCLREKPESRLLRAHRRLGLLYLNRVKRLDFDMFSPSMALPPPFLHLRFVFWPL